VNFSDYDRVARAIAFISEHVAVQPSLEDIAAHVHLSPFHFQRLFCRWAGITPKRFLQVLTLEHGKRLLEDSQTLLEVADTVGLSSTSRLHDHFVHLEAVTPGDYKRRGQGLNVTFGLHATPFGEMLVAVTPRGVCRAVFLDDEDPDTEITDLEAAWPGAMLSRDDDATKWVITSMFQPQLPFDRPLSLHVAGTNFQIAVWKALLRIPQGRLVSYSQLAAAVGTPRSTRAVGRAVGANPTALLIPCHRVIRQSGALGGYRWGEVRKRVIQTWEWAQVDD
jgi:AraC family transcriptional regulator, regulatory protein of adaptative response / methylated-DNA-[protein]-cysteine methyltransferase